MMLLTFGNLLDLAGIDRKDVRLLRHQDNRYPGFPTPYAMWRDDRPRFEAYQETQGVGDAPDPVRGSVERSGVERDPPAGGRRVKPDGLLQIEMERRIDRKT